MDPTQPYFAIIAAKLAFKDAQKAILDACKNAISIYVLPVIFNQKVKCQNNRNSIANINNLRQSSQKI